ncbi:gallinacin-12-like [Neopsephotus bourkii]|uniref:gallinacin-12-like n=1 Tax=Neopsephotus bourkii TaxID=309878 RepID=UPI002AA52417|nr:gallinacin-12-like [Neopsephotus bourkii]
MLPSVPATHRGFCMISGLHFSSRTKAMEILWFMLIFISLMGHGDAHGPLSCKHEGGACHCRQDRGFCRLGTCEPGEYLAKYCFEPIILCCKNLTYSTAKS